MVVRDARAEDVPAMVRCIVDVAAEGRWLLLEPPVNVEAWTERFLGAVVGSDVTLVAEADGEVVGNLGLQGGGGFRPWVLGMSVSSEWRGRGVGSALVTEAIERTRAAGVHKLWLEVFPHNEAGIALYRKFGFVEEGRLRGHYRRRNGELWDVVLMGLALAP